MYNGWATLLGDFLISFSALIKKKSIAKSTYFAELQIQIFQLVLNFSVTQPKLNFDIIHCNKVRIESL